MRNYLLITITFFISFQEIRAQDPHFSQFFANPVYLNPAYAGFDAGQTITINSRDQWFGIPDGSKGPTSAGYRIYNATVNHQFPCLKGAENANFGIALSGFGDYAGSAPLKTQGFGLALSNEVNLGGRKRRVDLRIGAQYSFMWKKLESDYLIYSHQLDPFDGFTGDPRMQDFYSKGYSNLNMGILLRGTWRVNKDVQHLYTAGYTFSNLTEPNISLLDGSSLTKLPMRQTIYAGFTYMVKEYVGTKKPWYIAPQFRFDFQRIKEEPLPNSPKVYYTSMTMGTYLFWSKYAYAGAFVQWNPSKRVVTNDVTIGVFARDNTFLTLAGGIDLRSLTKQRVRGRKRYNKIILGISYDIQLTGLPNGTTLGILELSCKINFTKRKKKRCSEIARFELYDGQCPLEF